MGAEVCELGGTLEAMTPGLPAGKKHSLEGAQALDTVLWIRIRHLSLTNTLLPACLPACLPTLLRSLA